MEEVGESWEDKADMSSAATTPDDDENSMEDDTGELEVDGDDEDNHEVTGAIINANFLLPPTDDEDEKGYLAVREL